MVYQHWQATIPARRRSSGLNSTSSFQIQSQRKRHTCIYRTMSTVAFPVSSGLRFAAKRNVRTRVVHCGFLLPVHRDIEVDDQERIRFTSPLLALRLG